MRHTNGCAEIDKGHPSGPSVITSFPPELLEPIFLTCDCLPLSSDELSNRLAISQVCRQWRIISLNLPTMWGRIDVGNTRLTREFLVRSGGAPLDIISKCHSRGIKVRGEDLQPHSSRIRSFDISFRREYELANLFHRLGDDMPNLTTFALRHLLSQPPLSTPIYCNVLRPPRLERLELWGVAVSWVNRVGSNNLTTLVLRGIGHKYSPSIIEFHIILVWSPFLEYLSIDRVNTIATQYSADSPSPLPHLRVLAIEEQESVIYAILKCITIPQSTHVTLDFRFLFRLQPLLPPEQNSAAYSYDQEVTRIVVHDTTIKLLRPTKTTTETPDTEIHLEDRQDSAAYFSGLSAHFDFARFTTFELNKDILLFLTPHILGGFLSRFTGLDTVRVAPNSEEPHALTRPTFGTTSRSPSLQTSAVAPCSNEMLHGSKSLLAVVRDHHRAAKPLALLDIKIPIPTKTVLQLKDLVGEVKALAQSNGGSFDDIIKSS